MEKETLDIIAKAISDVGYLRWWIIGNDFCQIEFGGVQLLNNDSINKDSKSAIVALQYTSNSFLIFYDKIEETDWYIKLQNNKIEPFTLDCDYFIFNNYNSINEIENEYGNKQIVKRINNMEHIKNMLVFKAGNVAVVIGGDDLKVVDENGIIEEEKIIEKNKLWWLYWKDYWKKRKSRKAYIKDYACEVTIPIKESFIEKLEKAINK